MSSGYDAEIVAAFLRSRGLEGMGLTARWRRVAASWHRNRIVPLGDVDEFLMAHGLMIWELEQWAIEKYRRDGFIDPSADPGDLAA